MIKKYRRTFYWVAGAVVLAAVLYLALFFYGEYFGFGAPSHPDFSGYKPTVLPNAITVTGQSLRRDHQVGMDYWTFYYKVSVSSKDFTVNEMQTSPYDSKTISCKGYGGACTVYQTSRGRTYRVWYSYSQGKPFGLQVGSFIGNTEITILVNNPAINKYIKYDWNPVFDSMQKVDLSHAQFSKQNYSGWGG